MTQSKPLTGYIRNRLSRRRNNDNDDGNGNGDCVFRICAATDPCQLDIISANKELRSEIVQIVKTFVPPLSSMRLPAHFCEFLEKVTDRRGISLISMLNKTEISIVPEFGAVNTQNREQESSTAFSAIFPRVRNKALPALIANTCKVVFYIYDRYCLFQSIHFQIG